MSESCPRPINTATDHSAEWCKRNGHCGCVEIDVLRKKYGELLYPMNPFEFIENEVGFVDCDFDQTIDRLHFIRDEVQSVITQLDELAELWGDEGKFRRCRDRLRKLVK